MNKWLSWDSPTPTIDHLTKYFVPGAKDPVWIPQVQNGNWIILSQDRGKRGKDKLPNICVLYKITHIILSKSVAHMKQHQKANAIISVWEQIKKCNGAPKGTRFRLRLNHAGRPFIEEVKLT
jgi:hypothetical protein